MDFSSNGWKVPGLDSGAKTFNMHPAEFLAADTAMCEDKEGCSAYNGHCLRFASSAP